MRLRSSIRALGAIAFFTLLAPPLGVLLFYLVEWFSFSSRSNIPMLLGSDMLHSYSEFGAPALIGGTLFAVGLVLWARFRATNPNRTIGALVGAVSLSAVFIAAFLHKVLSFGSFSRVLLLIAALAAIVGAALGGAAPRALFQLRREGENDA